MKFCRRVSRERICGRQSKVDCNTRRDSQRAAQSTTDHSITTANSTEQTDAGQSTWIS